MDEKPTSELKLVHYLMIATAVCYGGLVLFLKLKGNFAINPIWPFIRFGCKWSLFGWMFYGGVAYGKHLIKKGNEPIREKIKSLEDELHQSTAQNKNLEQKLKSETARLKNELQKQRQIESNLIEKVKRYERSGEDANRIALKNFL